MLQNTLPLPSGGWTSSELDGLDECAPRPKLPSPEETPLVTWDTPLVTEDTLRIAATSDPLPPRLPRSCAEGDACWVPAAVQASSQMPACCCIRQWVKLFSQKYRFDYEADVWQECMLPYSAAASVTWVLTFAFFYYAGWRRCIYRNSGRCISIC